MRRKRGGREGGGRGVHTSPHSGSLLPVVMVIRGFGQDYEIFYLVASALLERTSRPACSLPVCRSNSFSFLGEARTLFVTYTAAARQHAPDACNAEAGGAFGNSFGYLTREISLSVLCVCVMLRCFSLL